MFGRSGDSIPSCVRRSLIPFKSGLELEQLHRDDREPKCFIERNQIKCYPMFQDIMLETR